MQLKWRAWRYVIALHWVTSSLVTSSLVTWERERAAERQSAAHRWPRRRCDAFVPSAAAAAPTSVDACRNRRWIWPILLDSQRRFGRGGCRAGWVGVCDAGRRRRRRYAKWSADASATQLNGFRSMSSSASRFIKKNLIWLILEKKLIIFSFLKF